MELLTAVLGGVLGTFTQNLMYMAAFAVVFSALTIFDSQACNPGNRHSHRLAAKIQNRFTGCRQRVFQGNGFQQAGAIRFLLL